MKQKKRLIAAALLAAVLACTALAGCGGDPAPAAVEPSVLTQDSMTEYLGSESIPAVDSGAVSINTGTCPNNGICINNGDCPNDGVCINNDTCPDNSQCINHNSCPKNGACDGTGFVGGRNPDYFSGHHGGGHGSGPCR